MDARESSSEVTIRFSRALSESSSEVTFFFGLDEASFGGALAGIVGVVVLCILCFCFGRRVLMRFCLGRPYYCCCCPCIEVCGCCQGFKPDSWLHTSCLTKDRVGCGLLQPRAQRIGLGDGGCSGQGLG